MSRVKIPAAEEAPAFMERRPGSSPAEPTPREECFRGRPYPVWHGHVPFEKISLWIDNPRTKLLTIKWKREFGTLPSSDQLAQRMVDDEQSLGSGEKGEPGLQIKELADHIGQNGLRRRLILSRDGKLLDGNRRYAALWWINEAYDEPNEDAQLVPVCVVNRDPSDDEAVRDILTDLNFVGEYHREWSQYVKAKILQEEWNGGDPKKPGYSLTRLGEIYGWRPSRVRSHIGTAELIDDFLMFHDDSPEAEELAHEHFIWFEQIYRTCSATFRVDPEFRNKIFEWLMPPDGQESRFEKTDDFKRLVKVWSTPAAREALEAKPGPAGLREAHYILDGEQIASDPAGKLDRLTKELVRIRNKGDLDRVDGAILNGFHTAATQIPGAPANASARIDKMMEWLDSTSAIMP